MLYFDTETTGLLLPQAAPLESQPHIVQFCIIADDGTSYASLIKPPIQIPPEVSRIHGVTDAHVVYAPTFAEVANNLAQWLTGQSVSAYNASFDQNVLRYEFMRLGRPLPPAHWFDPMHTAQYETGKRWKQADLYAALMGKELLNAHDAIADTLALKEICEALRTRRVVA